MGVTIGVVVGSDDCCEDVVDVSIFKEVLGGSLVCNRGSGYVCYSIN